MIRFYHGPWEYSSCEAENSSMWIESVLFRIDGVIVFSEFERTSRTASKQETIDFIIDKGGILSVI